MTEEQAVDAVRKMNAAFAKHDFEFKGKHADRDKCRELDQEGQAIKCQLMQAGWELGVSKGGGVQLR